MYLPPSRLRVISVFAIALILCSFSLLNTQSVHSQDDATPAATDEAVSDLPHQIDVSGKPADVIKILVDAGLISKGGSLVLKPISGGTYSRSQGTQHNTGYWLGDPYGKKSTQVKNMVINFDVKALNLASTDDSCGMYFRELDRTDQYTAAMLTSGNHFLLSQNDGKKVVESLDKSIDDLKDFDPSYELGRDNWTTVTLIVVDETITEYVNGYLVHTSDKFKPIAGDIYMAVHGEADAFPARICNYNNWWVWSLDKS
jgi:hypothetical protein